MLKRKHFVVLYKWFLSESLIGAFQAKSFYHCGFCGIIHLGRFSRYLLYATILGFAFGRMAYDSHRLDWIFTSERVLRMVRLDLTRDEARMLEMFLLMTTKYREEQVETYRKLQEDWMEHGNASEKTIQTLADNERHWKEQCLAMDEIRKRVSTILTTPGEAELFPSNME